ncbi:MAG TPA: FtsX-like permease family protein [Vicinamibacterales bacterium]|nr:FtsX-like permease family protein [Vicinamibacterales bacterium]
MSAGLFIRSLANVSGVDLGSRTERLVTFGASPELNGYTPQQSRAFFERGGRARVAARRRFGCRIPRSADQREHLGSNVSVEGFEAGPDTDTAMRLNRIGPGYFRTLGIPLLAGRELTEHDTIGTPKVAIVNEAFARKFNLGRGAVGKRMAIGRSTNLEIEIVGLVQDAKYSDVKEPAPPQFFTPYRQDESVGALSFYVRTHGDPEPVLGAIPAAVRRLDPNLPVENARTMEMQVRDNVSLDRLVGMLSTAFAVLATRLAAVGLHAILAYTVAQRTREIGLRMALGADASRVRGMVLRQVGLMMLVGGAVGLAAALAVGRAAGSLLFELEPHDPWIFAAAAVLLTVVALGSGFIPAHRASQIDPMQALRYE